MASARHQMSIGWSAQGGEEKLGNESHVGKEAGTDLCRLLEGIKGGGSKTGGGAY